MIQFQIGQWYQTEGHYDGPEYGEYGFTYFPSVKVLKRSVKTITVEDEYGNTYTRRIALTRSYLRNGTTETFTIRDLGNARFYADIMEM